VLLLYHRISMLLSLYDVILRIRRCYKIKKIILNLCEEIVITQVEKYQLS